MRVRHRWSHEAGRHGRSHGRGRSSHGRARWGAAGPALHHLALLLLLLLVLLVLLVLPQRGGPRVPRAARLHLPRSAAAAAGRRVALTDRRCRQVRPGSLKVARLHAARPVGAGMLLLRLEGEATAAAGGLGATGV